MTVLSNAASESMSTTRMDMVLHDRGAEMRVKAGENAEAVEIRTRRRVTRRFIVWLCALLCYAVMDGYGDGQSNG